MKRHVTYGDSGMKGSQMNIPRQTAKGNPRCALMAAAFAFAALSITPLGDRAVFGQCNYEVTTIVTGPDCPFFGQAALIPTALNERGDMAGYWLECDVSANQAFFWSAKTGVLTTLPRPPGVWSAVATGLNDNGLIIGTHSISGVGDRGFVYDLNNPGAGFTYLPTLHGAGQSWATSINNAGVVAGARSISKSGNNPYNAVIWVTNTKEVIDLGVMSGPNSWATSINHLGQATGGVGTQFFNNADVWVMLGEEPIFTGLFPGGASIGATGINAFGTVSVGGQLEHQPDGPATQGALWDQGDWELLPLPDGATGGGPLAINDHRQAVGRALFASGVERGTLWQHGEVHQLSDLIVAGQDAPLLERGRAINNAGQILVRSSTKAVLLTPINVRLADLNFDCRVNVHDLWILFEQWGPVPRSKRNDRSGDLNGDGVVDVADLLILFDNWTN
jgi:uncharacterized membrane protein